jgi:DNA-binding response OmpR family regulator
MTQSPIVVLGAGEEMALAKALLSGADVHLKRPVSLPELTARIRALLRRHRGADEINDELRC